ncbi:MAG: hypothetical protein IJ128_01765 [Firmicutes bacterium]|nr:hypothetical protein [Bacillota bacterium]
MPDFDPNKFFSSDDPAYCVSADKAGEAQLAHPTVDEVNITIAQPACGDTVLLEKYTIPAGARPEVAVPEDADYSVAFVAETETPATYWGTFEEGYFNEFDDGFKLVGGESYYALVDLQPAEGKRFFAGTEVTINGKTVSSTDFIKRDNGNIGVISEAIEAAHVMEHTEAVAPVRTKAGNKEYWYCSKCENYFKDEAGEQEYETDGWIEPATGSPEVVEAADAAYKLIGEAEEYRSDIYSARTFAALQTALDALKQTLADNSSTAQQITEGTQALQSAIDGLKMEQTLNVKATKKTVKVKKLKKKAQTVKPLTVKGQKTTVTYKGTAVGKKAKKALKINKKTGKITVKKKTKKGTYKMKVTVTAAGNAKYEAATKKVTVTIRVK